MQYCYRYHTEVFLSVHSDPVLVFDVGGSHISTAICLLPQLSLMQLERTPLPAKASVEAFLDTLTSSAQRVQTHHNPPIGAAIAIAGPFDYSAGISHMRHKLEYLRGFDLKRALAHRFNWTPNMVHFLNDAAAFLQGELATGPAQRAQKAIGVTIGTGIGSAFAHRGRLITQGLNVPHHGEIWNLPYNGGIIEDFISTRAIQASYLHQTGRSCDVKTIASLASHEPAAQQVFANFGQQLGRILRHITTDFAPDVIVIGGGIAHASHLFLAMAQQELGPSTIQLQVSTQLDQAPLIGAAVSWFNHVSSHTIQKTATRDAI